MEWAIANLQTLKTYGRTTLRALISGVLTSQTIPVFEIFDQLFISSFLTQEQVTEQLG